MDFPEILKLGNKRVFLQRGGPGPANGLTYSGVDTQHLAITGATRPILGGFKPVNVSNPFRMEDWVQVGAMKEPPGDFPNFSLEMYTRDNSLPFAWGDLTCPINAYVVAGVCVDPSNFDLGWKGMLEIYGGGQSMSHNAGDRSSLDGNEAVKDALEIAARRMYAVGEMQFGAQAAATVVREIVDVAIAPGNQCGNCPPRNDGFDWMYLLQSEDAGVTAGNVLYSVDGGLTFTAQAVTGLANTDVVEAIEVIGNYLVVVGFASGGVNTSSYFISPINQLTGVPSTTWTEVTSGFVALSTARDIVDLNPREIYLVGDAGAIYKSTDLTAGVTLVRSAAAETLFRVAYMGSTIVSVGNVGAVVVSINRGHSFGRTTVDPSGTDLRAIGMRTESEWWVGDTLGGVWYTETGGESWVSKSLGGGLTLVGIQDIVWVTPEVGWIAATIAGPLARIFYTNNGGRTWVAHSESNNPRIHSMPSYQRANRIMAGQGALQNNVNTLLLGGLGTGTDGIAITGRANEV